MREAIQQYVEREKAREGFRLEVLASWSAYQADGSAEPSGGRAAPYGTLVDGAGLRRR